jgi:hypothetical protein
MISHKHTNKIKNVRAESLSLDLQVAISARDAALEALRQRLPVEKAAQASVREETAARLEAARSVKTLVKAHRCVFHWLHSRSSKQTSTK